ncbi:acylphosphatase [Candidatus Bathyarchaeota archaeon]|nr:acylphosphatase [Candidatus Bathyarchaeota archaeon]
MKVRAHIYVSGHVQGVFFRHETRKHALRLGVSGWIRNLPDGRVEAIFEGEKDAVDDILDFCRRGPPGAIVKDVEVQWAPWTGEFQGFRIIY